MDYIPESLVGQKVFHKKLSGMFTIVSEPKNCDIVVLRDGRDNDIVVPKSDVLLDINFIK